MSENLKPAIRFKEFTDDWEKRKLGEIADVTKLAGFEFTEHVVYSEQGNVIALRGLNIKNGRLVLDDVKYIDNSNFPKLNRSKLYINDIMFTYVGTVGEVAIIEENDRFYLAPNVSRIRVKSDVLPSYISHYMRSENFYNRVIFPLIATSSQPALSMENIRKFDIDIPCEKEEQQKIGSFFRTLDHLITLQQRKCESLSNVKKAMLEKMFPKNGSVAPEIRFSGFDDVWEKRKLGEVVDVHSGKDYKHLSEGDIPVYGTGGYMLSVNKALSYDEDAIGIGRKGTIDKPYILKAPFWTVDTLFYAVPRANIDLDFVFNIFQNIDWKKKDESTGVPSLSKTAINEIYVFVPNFEKQQVIGSYFSHLDHLITLYQSKLEKLKNIKKTCLEKMFV